MTAAPTDDLVRMMLRTALYDRFALSAAELGLRLGPIIRHDEQVDGAYWSIEIVTRRQFLAGAEEVVASVRRSYPTLGPRLSAA